VSALLRRAQCGAAGSGDQLAGALQQGGRLVRRGGVCVLAATSIDSFPHEWNDVTPSVQAGDALVKFSIKRLYY